jgi:molecular chaperone GrpE (heat shock protein)
MAKKKPATMKDLADLKNQNQSQSSGQSQNAIDETTPTTPAQSQSTTPTDQININQPTQTTSTTEQPTSSGNADANTHSANAQASNAISSKEQELLQEIETLKAKNLRLLADIQNLLRQNQIDIERAKKTLKTEIALAMVDFVTSMHLAFTYLPDNLDDKTRDFIRQLQLSLESSIKNLQSLNIELLIPKVGEPFNSEYMNAVNTPTDEASNLPAIKSVVTVGLKVDGQLVKPVQVLL